VLFLGLAGPGHAAIFDGVPQRAPSDILKERSFQFWQRINEARQNPLATAARLGVPEYALHQVFAGEEWILERGLPPLAWSDALTASAAAHGRDMFDRVYYSYVSPEGIGYWQRIEATGFVPAETGESMNALFFENLMPLDQAFDILVDIMLRDELSGNPSVERNIFSPDLTQVGVGFFAESISLLGDQPYVYLLMADFARPVTPQPSVIGTYPTDCAVWMQPIQTGGWFPVRAEENQPQLPAGMFQVPLAVGGAHFVLVDKNGLGDALSYVTVTPEPTGEENTQIILSPQAGLGE
jgi:hypothetical protein